MRAVSLYRLTTGVTRSCGCLRPSTVLYEKRLRDLEVLVTTQRRQIEALEATKQIAYRTFATHVVGRR